MKKVLLVLAMAAALSACHDNTPAPQPQGYAFSQPAEQVVAPAPQVQAAPTQVIVNQAPAASTGSDHLLTGALLGGAVGYMAGSANRQPVYQQPMYAPRPYVDRRPIVVQKTVVQKNVYVNKVVQAPKVVAPTPAPVAPRLSLSKSSGSSFGGFSRRSGR